jgi:hypothetical protein
VKLVISDAHEGLKAAAAKVIAAINTDFVQESFEKASAQWRLVADHLRGKLPKLDDLMDGAEAESTAPNRLRGSMPRSSVAPAGWGIPERRVDHAACRKPC